MCEFVLAFDLRPIQITPVCYLLVHRLTQQCSINIRMKNTVLADIAPAKTAILCLDMGCAL